MDVTTPEPAVALACYHIIVDSYARADAGRRSTIADLFVPDGRQAIGPSESVGREAIREALAARDRLDRRTVHAVSNVRFAAQEAGVVRADYVLTLYVLGEDGDSRIPDALCRVQDVLVDGLSGWLLRSRDLTIEAGG